MTTWTSRALEQSAKWGSYEKAAWGMHSTQITAEEENHVEDHTTEIEGECYCQETIAMSASTAAHAFMHGCTTDKAIIVEKQSWEARYYDSLGVAMPPFKSSNLWKSTPQPNLWDTYP